MARRIICIGDSNTYGYDPAAFGGARYPEGVRWTSRLGSAWDIRNLGENGREIPSSSFAVRVLLSQVRSRLPADGLCLMLGTNDLLCGASPAEAAERMRIFISDLLVCGLPLLLVAPALIRSSGQLAPLYRDLAALCGVSFCDASGWDIPVVFDGVHFSEQGHRRFAEQLEPVFARTFL